MQGRDGIILGERRSSHYAKPYVLSLADRRQHVYVVGASGAGKSTFLRELILQDIEAGRGVALIDPHGDLAESVIELIPSRRFRETIYFDPADVEFPIGINPLYRVPIDRRHLVADGIVDGFAAIWSESWGPRLEYILHRCVAALLDLEDATLLAIPKLLTDKRYRMRVARRVRDPLVRHFWESEFPSMGERLQAEAVSPIQNKIGRLLASPPLRNVLGQVRSRIDFRFVIDRRRIFIANLSKGRLGADASAMLGSVIASEFFRVAFERADSPEDSRDDYALIIDEFHNVATTAFATAFPELRKQRLSLICAHQFLDQLRPAVRSAVFGGVGTIAAFRVSQADAELLERELDVEVVRAAELGSLPRGLMIVRALENGLPAVPFRCAVTPPPRYSMGRRGRLIRSCRQRYAQPRAEVENRVSRFLKSSDSREMRLR